MQTTDSSVRLKQLPRNREEVLLGVAVEANEFSEHALRERSKTRGNPMNEAKRTEDFEQMLLSHTEMCFSVALALTRNREDARDLARETLAWAWRRRGAAGGPGCIKADLLKELRRGFLCKYGRPAAPAVATNVLRTLHLHGPGTTSPAVSLRKNPAAYGEARFSLAMR
jgi:hypothetical protein